MRNLHLLKKVMAFILLFAVMVSFIPLNVYAETVEISTFAEISEVRKDDKQSELKEIYKTLFPDEYHYIIEYEKNGVGEMDGSGVLYDIGVGVGNNKAKGISQVSSGVDMWVWTFIYAFFFGD